jgi:hypothetical protein
VATNIREDGPAPTAWRRREVKVSVSWAGLSASLGRWGEESPPLVQRLFAAAERGLCMRNLVTRWRIPAPSGGSWQARRRLAPSPRRARRGRGEVARGGGLVSLLSRTAFKSLSASQPGASPCLTTRTSGSRGAGCAEPLPRSPAPCLKPPSSRRGRTAPSRWV